VDAARRPTSSAACRGATRVSRARPSSSARTTIISGAAARARWRPTISARFHHGADDNASGTAAVIALARAFAKAGGTPRTLVFVAFGAEEMGLLGSAHYVKQPAWPLDGRR
jgi:Iap family predicted aminopeptidase